MDSSTIHRNQMGRRKDPQTRREPTTRPSSSSTSWCCSFKTPPRSPETLSLSSFKPHHAKIVGPAFETHLSKSLNPCQDCLSSLVTLFVTANGTVAPEKCNSKTVPEKPLIESVSWQVENINWLLEILLDRQISQDFVDLWACQKDLLKMHQKASPMVRYELSRVSAVLFVAMGTRKLQCQAESRYRLLNSWFGPMLLDFGWLQRCRKGLDVRELEEAMGQALLTLPLKQQYGLFMEWFRCFSKHGTECPNLSKAFQIWWRRSFLRGSETHSIESR